VPFAPQLYRLGFRGSAALAGVIGCASACACACLCPRALPEACCCGGAAGVVSGLLGRLSRGIASEICRLWVPAAGVAVAVAAVGAGSALANSSLIDTRSSSSLEMMSGEVPPGRSGSSAQAYPAVALGACVFHSGVPQEGHRVGWISSAFPFPLPLPVLLPASKGGVPGVGIGAPPPALQYDRRCQCQWFDGGQ
jgi:hypothetical protein